MQGVRYPLPDIRNLRGPNMQPNSSYNHPDQPVRHSYPLAISSAGFSESITLLIKTMPYVLIRFGILVAVSIGTILWFGATFGGAGLLGHTLHPWIGYAWLFAGLGIYGWIWATVVRYGLYLIKCGHIAVLTELITTGAVDNGKMRMFDYGKKIVTERFSQVNTLFALDVLIDGIVGAFNATLDFVTKFVPIPGLKALANLASVILKAATTYIDETIFSYNLARGEDNAWRGGRDGLLYYCQNSTEILKTATICVIADYILTAIAWVLFLAPAAMLAMFLPFVAGWTALVAVLFAINFRQAVLRPLFLIMIMIKFHSCVKGQAINEEWEERLRALSPKFNQLTAKISAG